MGTNIVLYWSPEGKVRNRFRPVSRFTRQPTTHHKHFIEMCVLTSVTLSIKYCQLRRNSLPYALQICVLPLHFPTRGSLICLLHLACFCQASGFLPVFSVSSLGRQCGESESWFNACFKEGDTPKLQPHCCVTCYTFFFFLLPEHRQPFWKWHSGGGIM